LSGDDTLNGSSGSDTIGFAGNDILNGGMGADSLNGGTGDDWYFVDNAGDTITELAGEGTLDRVFASASYNLTSGAAVENLSTANHAGTEAINLRGNELANTIFGNAGMNIISGGLGNDTLVGLGGNDYFLFERTPGVGNVEQIGDFTPGQDHVLLLQSVFTSPSTGMLADANFLVRGTAFQDANDFIIYDQSTGALFYDADGSGAGAAVPFANVTANLPLHASDFQIV
jgi:Ca2+-binding RTX toxin-like protein